MVLILTLLAVVTVLELCLWLISNLSVQRVAAPLLLISIWILSVALVVLHRNAPTVVFLLLSVYRMVNLLRLAVARIHQRYLQRSTAQTGIWLASAQFLLLVAWFVWSRLRLTIPEFWVVLAALTAGGSFVLLLSTLRHLRTTSPPDVKHTAYADTDMPTLTVAIPARNETDDLESCLETLLASDYPKLEIIVLDDCSQNQRTPEIIRSFAHRGVRFLEGSASRGSWLAKNAAYQQLFEASNGELVAFCGVDVRFTPDSLRSLVASLLQKKKSMISIIPRNVTPHVGSWQQSILLQPMRYAWELALPRRLFRRPPVLSTCWIIRRDVLESAGGFGAVSRSIVPESYFARVSTIHDGYSFMQSDKGIGVVSTKKFRDQLQTVIRTRYPQVHRRIELVALLSIAEGTGVLLPCWIVIRSIRASAYSPAFWLSSSALLVISVVYMLLVSLTYRKYLLRSIIAMPLAVASDIVLLNYSMLAYEFWTVTWKGRNVCIPVMRIQNATQSDGQTAVR